MTKNHRENTLAELSITRIAGLVGMAKETVAKRLREAGLEPARTDGRTIFYAAREALRVLHSLPARCEGDLSELSITRIAALVGMAKETVAKRLREADLEPARTDGRTIFYRTREALRVLLRSVDRP